MPKTRSLGCLISISLTFIMGIILLIAGSIFTNQTTYTLRIWSQIYVLSIFSIVIAVLAILISLALLYVVVREYPALTASFSGFIIFVAFLAVICGVVLITGRYELESAVKNKTTLLIRNYSDTDSVNSSKAIVSKLQKYLHCCGADGPSDWKTQLQDEKSVPDSCCIISVPDCGKDGLLFPKNIYQNGCSLFVYDHLYGKYDALIGMNFAMVILALLAGIFGIIYERYMREKYQSI